MLQSFENIESVFMQLLNWSSQRDQLPFFFFFCAIFLHPSIFDLSGFRSSTLVVFLIPIMHIKFPPTLSFIAEVFLFLYVGMDALDLEKWSFVSDSLGKSFGVSSILLGLVLVGRAAFVFPLSFLSNLSRKSPNYKITLKQQVTIWWAGLMRGAVSIALAYNQFTKAGHTQQRGNAFMITSTITVVLFSTVVFGLLTKPLVGYLLPPTSHIFSSSLLTDVPSPKSLIASLISYGQTSDVEQAHCIPPETLLLLLSEPTRSVHRYWRSFDNSFMRPLFGGRGFTQLRPGTPAEPEVPPPQE